MTTPNTLPLHKKILAISLFVAAIVFNFIAIKILRALSKDSAWWEYGYLLLFLAAGFGSLWLSQRLRVVKKVEE